MPRRRRLAKPPTEAEMLALREEMQRLFPCKSWQADRAAEDGSVDFRCDCGAASGHYPSHAEGELALGEHLDAVDADRRKYFTDWVRWVPVSRWSLRLNVALAALTLTG